LSDTISVKCFTAIGEPPELAVIDEAANALDLHAG
jgi:hypothetical protein